MANCYKYIFIRRKFSRSVLSMSQNLSRYRYDLFFFFFRIDNCREERRTGWAERRFTVERSLWCTSNFAKWTTGSWFLGGWLWCKRYQKYCNAGKVSDEPTGPKILGKQPRVPLRLFHRIPSFNLTRMKITWKRNFKSNTCISVDLVSCFNPEYWIILSKLVHVLSIFDDDSVE